MSWFIGDDGKRYEIFGTGGGQKLAEELGVPLLGQVPLNMTLREGGDAGNPIVTDGNETDVHAAFAQLAKTIAAQGQARVYRQELRLV